MSNSASVAALLQHLVTLPNICLVIGAHEAIGEMFLDPATMDFRVDGAFVTMENGPWHIHLDATKVHKTTFVIAPDTSHHSTHLSDSVRFLDAQGATLLRAFFLAMYDEHAHLRPERVQQYEALRDYGEGRDIPFWNVHHGIDLALCL
jgi:putative heme iron utilization protein